ncbi:hypothetical protein ISCGN_011605 [Ixodes scapularis]
MHRARVVLGNDAVLRNRGLAHLRRRRKAVAVFGEEVNQLTSFRVRKLRVNVELRWRRTVLLGRRGFVSNRGDFGGVSEFLDVAHGCTFPCYFIEKGARAVLSLQSSSSAAVAHSVCARFHIPFLTVRDSTSADRQGGGSRSFKLKFHPDQEDVSSAFLDLLLTLEWRSFTLIYNSDSAFVRLRDVMKYAFRPPGKVRLVQCCAERQSYDSIILELKAKHELRVMLDLTPSEVDRFMTKVYPAKMAPTVFLGYRVHGLRIEELLEICLPDWGGAERQ